MSQKQDELSVTNPPKVELGETPPPPGSEPPPPPGSEPPPPPPPGSEPPPPVEEEEQTVDPEKLKQLLNTQKGLLKQTQKELSELKKRHLDFGEVKNAIGGIQTQLQEQGETLTLVTDVLNQMGEGNEELQQRVEANRKAREATQKQLTQAKDTYTDIVSILQLAEVDPDGDEAKPVREAFNARDYPKAKEQARLVVQTKVSALKIASPADGVKGEEEKVGEKGKQKVITKAPSAPPDWRDMSPKDKIKEGIAEAKKNQ